MGVGSLEKLADDGKTFLINFKCRYHVKFKEKEQSLSHSQYCHVIIFKIVFLSCK